MLLSVLAIWSHACGPVVQLASAAAVGALLGYTGLKKGSLSKSGVCTLRSSTLVLQNYQLDSVKRGSQGVVIASITYACSHAAPLPWGHAVLFICDLWLLLLRSRYTLADNMLVHVFYPSAHWPGLPCLQKPTC